MCTYKYKIKWMQIMYNNECYCNCVSLAAWHNIFELYKIQVWEKIADNGTLASHSNLVCYLKTYMYYLLQV